MTDTVDHSYTTEIVCPYCGYESEDSYEYFSMYKDSATIECADCGKEFEAIQDISVSYSTYKSEEDSDEVSKETRDH